jgi:radical SAM protein with 4Fe4S-binding SPASM domain
MNDPFHIQWHITNLCNLRCKHCYQEDFSKNNDLNWAGLKRVSDNILATLSEWNRKACIHLTGGEPLLKEELFSLLYHLDPKPEIEELGIITNGLLFNPGVVKRLSAFPTLKKIKISLDGADAEVHDSIRQKGVFEKVIQSLPMIKQETRFEIILMFTVMKRNYKSLPSLIRLCQNLGVDGLILERFIPLGRGKKFMNEVLEKDQWRGLVEILMEFFSMKVDEDDMPSYQAFQITFDEDGTELSGAPCVIGKDGLCIMPDGIVFPCRRFPIPIGNLVNESLKKIWESSSLLGELRKKKNLKGRCGKCEIEDCRGCRSLAFALTGDYLGEDPHCPLSLRVSSSLTR